MNNKCTLEARMNWKLKKGISRLQGGGVQTVTDTTASLYAAIATESLV